MGCWCTPSLSTFTDYAEPAPKKSSTALSINNHAAAELYNCKLSKSKALGFAVTTLVSAKFEPVDSPTPSAYSSFQLLSGYTALLPLLRRIAQDSWLDTTSGPQVHGFSGANEISEVLKRQPLGETVAKEDGYLTSPKVREKRGGNASVAWRERERNT